MTALPWIDDLRVDLADGPVDPGAAWALILADEPCPHGATDKRIYEAACCRELRELLSRHEFAAFRSGVADARRRRPTAPS